MKVLMYIIENDTFCETYNISEMNLLRKSMNPIIFCQESGLECKHDITCYTRLYNLCV